ncbi:MAG: hypothetical protein QMD86_01690 [Patescibacteria group bacterium]|nr:hypothetical protein [Patescibacteria group bacterium]
MKFHHSPSEKRLTDQAIFKNKKFLLGGAVFILAAIYAIFYSPAFKIQKIEISGANSLVSAELIQNLKDYFENQSKISLLLGSDNILTWGDSAEFLKLHPQFESLKMERNYLSRRINIEVKERKNYGIWCQNEPTETDITQTVTDAAQTENRTTTQMETLNQKPPEINSYLSTSKSECLWFDENGIIFKQAPIIDSELFNRVNDETGHNLKLGDPIMKKNLFDNLKKIFKILDIAEANIKTVHLKDISLEEVSTQSKPKLLFSLRFDPEFSLSAINSLKNSDKWKNVDYADFRVENRVYYMMEQ